MHTYKAKKFNLPKMEGISEKQMEVHLGLYDGYVTHVNKLRDSVHDLETTDKEKYAYAIMEMRRRLGFEFDGMRMHEYYFTQFEGGYKEVSDDSRLKKAVSEKYGSFDAFVTHFTTISMTRGIGWTVLYNDTNESTVHTVWVSDHEIGQLAGLPIILALDMWEHAFMVDYTPKEKKSYVEAFFKNLNWEVAERRIS